MLDLLINDILLFILLGLIAWIGLIFSCDPVPCRSYHVDVECEDLVNTLYNVDAWEQLAINLHGELPQDY